MSHLESVYHGSVLLVLILALFASERLACVHDPKKTLRYAPKRVSQQLTGLINDCPFIVG
jgi:hypothetical protein